MLKIFSPKQKIKAVLWDVDGTLVNTEHLHEQSIILACKDKGITLAHDDFDALSGRSQADNFRVLCEKYPSLNEIDFKTYQTMVHNHFMQISDVIDIIHPLLDTLLPKIANSDIRQAAVSNGSKPHVEKSIIFLEKKLEQSLFEFFLSFDDVPKGKPDPTPYLMAAQRLGVTPESCLVIEDSVAGLQSGISANMNTITAPLTARMYQANKDDYDRADLVVTNIGKIDWDTLLGF